MRVPGLFFMESAFAPVGWDPDSGDTEKVRQYRNCQYMTPETRGTSHFFWNYLRNFKQDDPNVSTSLRDGLLEGFMEDKVIIEAQQKLLELDDPFQSRGLVADVALSHFRKTWQRLIREEQEKYPREPQKIRNRIL